MKKGPGRPNLGKTETIRQRAITVYLPTKEMVEKWKAEADKHDMSLSSFITEIVDDAMRRKLAGVTPREELEKRLNESLSELKVLKGKLESADVAQKRADETIADYRKRLERTVPEELDAGITSQLVSAFMKKGTILVEEIPEKAGIDLNDHEGMVKIHLSLNFLKAGGLVENRVFDWRWKGATYKPRIPSAVKRRLRGQLH
jgi:hypothetical protein